MALWVEGIGLAQSDEDEGSLSQDKVNRQAQIGHLSGRENR